MTVDRARLCLLSLELAEQLGWSDRLTRRTETTGVIALLESDFLEKLPAGSRVEFGYPDILGRFTPTIYAPTDATLPIVEVPA